jgi:hypothetical protein
VKAKNGICNYNGMGIISINHNIGQSADAVLMYLSFLVAPDYFRVVGGICISEKGLSGWFR